MAQNTFVNATADKNSANKPDRQNHGHSCSIGAVASGDLTISFDSAVVSKLNTLDSLIASARAIIASSGLK